MLKCSIEDLVYGCEDCCSCAHANAQQRGPVTWKQHANLLKNVLL